jgi:hypothetical protein
MSCRTDQRILAANMFTDTVLCRIVQIASLICDKLRVTSDMAINISGHPGQI